jgi:CO/xanthine dehydrogenase Mo-binding subunit
MEEEYKPWQWKVPEGGVIGKRRVRRIDAYEKASGKAVYVRDIYLPGMLYGKLFLSPFAHAKIKRMDTAKAEALAGVRAVFRYDDPEDKKVKSAAAPGNFRAFSGSMGVGDMIPDTAHYFGQPVGAMVVADSEAICDRALRLIEMEWEQLSFIIDWDEALKPDAPILRPDIHPKNNINMQMSSKQGDVEKGFKESDRIIEFKMTDEEDNSTCVEAHACVAEWKGEYLEVWFHGQQPLGVYTGLANAGYAHKDKISVNTPYMGAQFGGLNWSRSLGGATTFPHYAVAAARRTGKPVKVLYDESHFHGGEETNGSYSFKVGFQENGKIHAVKVETVWALQAMHATLQKIRESTSIPHLSAREVIPHLSKPDNPCAKDGGGACAVPNMVFSHVAAELGMDPTQLALMNDGCDGEPMENLVKQKAEQGFNPDFDSLKECIAVGKKAIDWDRKWHPPGTRILPNGNYHGLGFFSTLAWNSMPGQVAVGMMLRDDGTCNILAQANDIGVSGPTAYVQVVADELGFKYSDVTMRHDKNVLFICAESGGSLGGQRTYPAMIRAARKLKRIILEHAVKPRSFGMGMMGPMMGPMMGGGRGTSALFPDKKPEDLDIKDSMVFEKANPDKKVKISSVMAPFMGMLNNGSPFFAWDYPPSAGMFGMRAFARQCYFTEVEVDPETGLVQIIKHVVVNDVGRAINPDAINGQQYGGSYMGIGRSNTEAIYYDSRTGVKLNDNHIGYEIPTMNDVGPMDCHILESGFGFGAYGTIGCSESGTACTTTVTGPAIYNAIGKWVIDFPTTPDKILKALGKI